MPCCIPKVNHNHLLPSLITYVSFPSFREAVQFTFHSSFPFPIVFYFSNQGVFSRAFPFSSQLKFLERRGKFVEKLWGCIAGRA